MKYWEYKYLSKSLFDLCGVIDTLKNNRSDVYFDNLWNKMTIFCEEYDVSLDIPSQGVLLWYTY